MRVGTNRSECSVRALSLGVLCVGKNFNAEGTETQRQEDADLISK